LVKKVYGYSFAGGGCHVVLDDWNIEDFSIDRTLEWLPGSDDPPEQVAAEKACMEAFRKLTLEERASVLRLDRNIE
jgi:hypothetical protein